VTHTHEIAFLGLMRLTLPSDHLYSRNSVSHVKTDRESPKYQRDQDRLQGGEDYRMPGRTTSGRASRAAVRHRVGLLAPQIVSRRNRVFFTFFVIGLLLALRSDIELCPISDCSRIDQIRLNQIRFNISPTSLVKEP